MREALISESLIKAVSRAVLLQSSSIDLLQKRSIRHVRQNFCHLFEDTCPHPYLFLYKFYFDVFVTVCVLFSVYQDERVFFCFFSKMKTLKFK